MYEINDHPDAPSREEMGEYVVEPVPPREIRRQRDSGRTLVEENLLEHEAVDAYVELTQPQDRQMVDIGTVLYRLVQIFGTPQFPEYQAGNDISWRDDDTFKYLFRVRERGKAVIPTEGSSTIDEVRDEAADDADAAWLITVFDHKIRLGVGLAEWHDDPDAAVDVDPGVAVTMLAIVKNGVTDPVQCEYKDKWF